jgi:hypothetical protein
MSGRRSEEGKAQSAKGKGQKVKGKSEGRRQVFLLPFCLLPFYFFLRASVAFYLSRTIS